MFDASSIETVAGVTFAAAIVVVFILINVYFCWSLYAAMSKVPVEKRVMPAWLCWLVLIPIVGFIFSWILLPFVIPKSLRHACEDNSEAVARSNSLFALGLTLMILTSISIIPFVGAIAGIAAIIIWIIYWVKIVEFRKRYMENTGITTEAK